MPILALLLVAVFSHAKSSQIPARREFPVNPAVSPCVDFYRYACSKVIDSFALRADRSDHDFAFSDASERLLDYQKNYFNNLKTLTPSGPRETMYRKFYLGCMNADAHMKDERELVKSTLSEIRTVKDRDAFLELLSQKRLTAESAPVGIFTASNLDRPLINDLALPVEWMSLPEKSYYEKPEVVAALRKVIALFFRSVGAPQPDQKAKMIVEFEAGLARQYVTPKEFDDLLNSRTQISREELVSQYPQLKFQSLLLKVPQGTVIRHLFPKAMSYLNTQLAQMSLEDLKALYLYNALSGDLDDAYPAFFLAKFRFDNKYLGGPEKRSPRQERCTRETAQLFEPEVESTLWPRIFPNFPTERAREVAEKIRASILHTLAANTWLSKAGREEAMHKIRSANLQLVAPQNDEEWNFGPLAEYATDHPVYNLRLHARLQLQKDLNELKGPISSKRWGLGPLAVNAYYDPSYNKFVLPVGILQYPFFDKSENLSDDLGGIGSVIGHELGHAVDDHGSLYDAEGKMRGWMTAADLKEFKSRSAKLSGQFTRAGMNGEFTLGENIGDLVGLSAAYNAAFGSPQAPASQREAKRGFFLQYARVYCEVVRPKMYDLRIKTDPHSSGPARVNEQVKQQPGFREAFECHDGDPMVLPADQLVKIW